MFAVVYRFDVKDGHDEAFVEAWAAVTEGLKEVAGTHGSCLHRTQEGPYIAYARWSSRRVSTLAP